MSSPLLVSIIVTTYNSATSISRTLDSLLAQQGRGETFNLQVIVVDDCSTDETARIVSQYSDVEFLVNDSNSGGPNRGRNRGLGLATGGAICIVDHDDEWMSDRLVRQLPGLTIASIVSCGYTVVEEQTGAEQVRAKVFDSSAWVEYAVDQTFLSRLSREPGGQTTYLGTLLYAAELAEIRFEEEFGAVDFDFVVRLFEGRASVEYAGSLYRRYVIGSNLSLREDYRLKDFEYSKSLLQHYRELYPLEASRGLRRLHGSLARYYYLIDRMPEARQYFLRGEASAKTLLYWLTTWVGARWVKRHFAVFG